MIVYEPTTFGTVVDAVYDELECVYVRPEIASEPTSAPTVTAYVNAGSVPSTTFDLSSALMVIGRGAMTIDCETFVAAA